MKNHTIFIPEEYQERINSDKFSLQPDSSNFDERRESFFRQLLENTSTYLEKKHIMFLVTQFAAGGDVNEVIIHKAISEFIESRKDCADFVMQAVLRILYQFNANSERSFSETLLSHAKEATLGFKYWPDEPGQDKMCTWTENHYILFTTSAYLAGQLFQDEVFNNSGRTGQEMMNINRPRILRWLEMRFKSGFSEWLSNVYYNEDWVALLNLIDLVDDNEIQNRARMVLNLSLFDMALNSFQGVFGSTHGRSYVNNKKWALMESTTDTSKLLFGTGAYSNFEFFSVGFFAISNTYQIPKLLVEIANFQKIYVNRQRMGHRTDDAEKWGLSLKNRESAMVFYSNSDFLHPKNAKLTLEIFDKYDWWNHSFHTDFKKNRKLLKRLSKLGLLSLAVRLLEKDISRNVRNEANIYTYRTPDYMLSSVQDYRPGYGGNQQHIWQATLGPNAVCFTTYPANEREIGASPNYWTGSDSLPRVAQVGNIAIIIYNGRNSFLSLPAKKLKYTHAWFPKDQFDEVKEHNGWIFAKKNEGYLALKSKNPYQWQEKPGENRHRELIAQGRKNIWICEMGRKATDGNFTQFIDKICNATLKFKGLSVHYDSPSQGKLKFGWKKKFRKEGRVICLDEYPRYENPYCHANFWADEIEIKTANYILKLNWKSGKQTLNKVK